MTAPQRSRAILLTIVASQFAGTSLWFAGNAVMGDLQRHLDLGAQSLGTTTSAVQLGFITGTLIFAYLTIADRFSPRRVFLACSLLGALANLAIYFFAAGLTELLALRFATGLFLAGVYPVGMKIAAGWFRDDLGRAIGYLVGALVLGTAFPHLLKAMGHDMPWEWVIAGVSAVAAAGGVAMWWLVPDGPYLARASTFDAGALARIFRSPRFRASAFGYFGHMWELYAFWTFVPVALVAVFAVDAIDDRSVALWSFLVIGAGALGCAVGGALSIRLGSARVAVAQLAVSGTCCALSPLLFLAPTPVFLAFLLVWGVTVVGDSPQFSTLNARNAPPELVGSALTIANCIGFAITIVSIQLLNALAAHIKIHLLFLPLVAGPLLGLLAMRPLLRADPAAGPAR